MNPVFPLLRNVPLLVVVGSALASVGCAEPLSVAAFPTEAAVAPRGKKDVGKVEYAAVGETKFVHLGLGHAGTLAQSGEGSLGDRLFRESPEGFVEGCRYVAKGRVCQLAALSDGTFLGGGVAWIVPKGGRATPRASGWAMRGIAMNPTAGVTEEQRKINALSAIFFGRGFHCRFADEGPVCLDVPATKEGFGYAILGALSVRDGATTKEVVWLGIFGEMRSAAFSADALGIREIQRCETSEESTAVVCKQVTMKGFQ